MQKDLSVGLRASPKLGLHEQWLGVHQAHIEGCIHIMGKTTNLALLGEGYEHHGKLDCLSREEYVPNLSHIILGALGASMSVGFEVSQHSKC